MVYRWKSAEVYVDGLSEEFYSGVTIFAISEISVTISAISPNFMTIFAIFPLLYDMYGAHPRHI